MNHAALIAQKLSEVVTAIGQPCTLENQSILFPKWSLRVDVVEGNTQPHSNGVTILPETLSRHPYLPHGFARELGVGVGKTLADAANHVAASWMTLFFPLLKFLFEDHPHDCLVHEQPVALPDPQGSYRLAAGPLQAVGAEMSAQLGEDCQSRLWNAFAEPLFPLLKPGVHHVRCYVARMPDGPSADVFVDGVEWPEGSRRLCRLAETFPPPSQASPVNALKQHLFVRPDDLANAAARGESQQIAEWMSAVQGSIGATSRELFSDILLALYVMSAGYTLEEQENLLVDKGVPPERAESLISFLQSAAARAVLKGKVQFSDTYYWANHRTRQAVERRYDQTPEFTAGLEVLGLLCDSGLASFEIQAVADFSAEMSVVRQAMAKTGKFTGGKFTQMIHSTRTPVSGVDLDSLLSRPLQAAHPRKIDEQSTPSRATKPNRPWWRFW